MKARLHLENREQPQALQVSPRALEREVGPDALGSCASEEGSFRCAGASPFHQSVFIGHLLGAGSTLGTWV